MYFRNESEPYMTIAVPSGRYGDRSNHRRGQPEGDLGRGFAHPDRARRVTPTWSTRSGHLIAHPDVSLVLQMRDLSELAAGEGGARSARAASSDDEAFAMVATGLDGSQVLATHAAIPSLGWLVFVEQPLGEVFAPLQARDALGRR